MGYRLAEQNGESVAVPRLVFAHLARADGDTIRAALYLLGGGGTDPRTMARDLGMPSIEAAKRAMQYWAGAGLLVSDRDAPLPKTEMQKASAIDLTTLNDPYVSVLCEEAQTAFGKALSRTDILTRVWGEEYFGEEKIVDVNIRRLRIKIEDDTSNPTYITTVWGLGYKWGA